MLSPRHHKGLLLLVTPPPSSRGVFTVTCDGIAKEQRGDSGVYATRIWTNQSLPKSPGNFNTILKLRLHDQFIQNGNEVIKNLHHC